jgi:hypothetical protein
LTFKSTLVVPKPTRAGASLPFAAVMASTSASVVVFDVGGLAQADRVRTMRMGRGDDEILRRTSGRLGRSRHSVLDDGSGDGSEIKGRNHRTCAAVVDDNCACEKVIADGIGRDCKLALLRCDVRLPRTGAQPGRA